MEEEREAEVQRGGRDVERAAAPQHRALLRLLGGHRAEGRQEGYRSCHGTYDIRHTQDVREMLMCLHITF